VPSTLFFSFELEGEEEAEADGDGASGLLASGEALGDAIAEELALGVTLAFFELLSLLQALATRSIVSRPAVHAVFLPNRFIGEHLQE
jgi:hypothetical protein